MQVLSAVVTTGIYCRPGCGGRPHPENVRPYLLAAAAESDGFRPCLRCRPYRTSGPAFWSGPELVCRAVQLITDGALDGGTEDQLAARLGVSGRHLRRLFVAELGVTPDGLARSRRAHFARRLLDDTDLPITDVAFAAGFGSVRQLHRACHDIFRAAPGELRARRRVTDRLVADGGLVLRMPYQGCLDWDALLAYLQARAIPGVEQVDGDTYRRTVWSTATQVCSSWGRVDPTTWCCESTCPTGRTSSMWSSGLAASPASTSTWTSPWPTSGPIPSWPR